MLPTGAVPVNSITIDAISAAPVGDSTVNTTAVPLPGDTRQDWWIIQELANRIGLDWKFESADLTVRESWGDYMSAYEDAIEKTSTKDAPWFVIPADRRWYRKLAVAEIVKATLEEMDPKYPPPEDGLEDLVVV